MNQISKEDMALCKRIDSLLDKAEGEMESFYDFANENDTVLKYAYLARAVVRELIEPLPELFNSISAIEVELIEFINHINADSDSYENSDDEDEDDE